MSSVPASERAIRRAVEQLYEDERLRADLTDEAATIALGWAERHIRERVEAAAPGASEESLNQRANDALSATRTTLREVNRLARERNTLDSGALGSALMALLDMKNRSPAMVLQVDDLVAAREILSDSDWIRGVLELLDRRAEREPPSPPTTSHPPEAARPAEQGTAGNVGPPPPAASSEGKHFREESSRTQRWALLALVGALLFCGCVLLLAALLIPRLGRVVTTPPEPSPPPVATPLPPVQETWYRLYFTSPLYPDDVALHTGTPIEDALVALIDGATRSVEMAIYQLDLEKVTRALLDARERGVTVRVVTDDESYLDPNENAVFRELENAGIRVTPGNSSGIMHNKFVVIDGRTVWTGSWNFTENDSYRYNNHAIAIDSEELADNYQATFQKMWLNEEFSRRRKPGGTRTHLSINGVSVESYFSPEDEVIPALERRLLEASESIYFLAFSFTHDILGDAMLTRAAEGVEVRGVFENTGSNTPFSEYGKMRQSGLEVYQDGNPYLMHHKVIIIDESTVVLGSFNFSQNAEENNDENLLIIDDPGIAGAFLVEFEKVLFQARNPPNR